MTLIGTLGFSALDREELIALQLAGLTEDLRQCQDGETREEQLEFDVDGRREDQLGGRITTLATDRSFSWIIAAPREHYNIPRYFAFHALTQAGVATLLVLVLQPLGRMAAGVFGHRSRGPGEADRTLVAYLIALVHRA